jgi:hypothetical protein
MVRLPVEPWKSTVSPSRMSRTYREVRLAVGHEADVADEPFVEDGVQCRRIVEASLTGGSMLGGRGGALL